MNHIIYFSPTGNAKYIASKIKSNLSSETKMSPLEFLNADKLEECEHLILVYSIHGFNVPRTVKRFIRSFPTNITKSISIISVGCTTSTINNAASLSIRKLLEHKGYNIIVDTVVAMPLTIVKAFPKAYIEDMLKQNEKTIKAVAHMIDSNKVSDKIIPFKARMLNVIGKIEDPASRLFGLELHANNKCTSCSICWKNCPEFNIKKGKNGKPKFGLNCMMCMRCIYECPTNAISPYISKFMTLKGGYKLTE